MRIPGLNFINGRLSMGARLGLLSTLFVAPTAMLLVMYTMQSWGNVAFAKLEASGAEYLAGMWPSFAAASLETAAPIGPGLAEVQGRLDASLKTAGPSAAFAGSESGGPRLTAGRTLIDAVTDATDLALDPDADSLALMLATTSSLPSLNADIAGVRAATSLPAADPERQARIGEALQRVRTSAAAGIEQIGDAMSSNPQSRTVLSAKAEALKSAAAQLDTHRTALLYGAGFDTVATDLAELHQRTDESWRASQAELHRLLKAREGRLIGELVKNLTIVLSALAAAAVLAMAIAGGLSGRIANLLKAMDRLIAGDIAVDVPHLDDRNETGRIAETVAAFKQSLIDGARLREERAEQEARAATDRQAADAERQRTAAEQAQVVNGIAQGLEKLSAGVLTFRLSDGFAASYEKLRADFNAAMEQMQQTMREVALNATGVRAGAGEISQASDDLSRRTEQQAASLEETAAALDEITATVRRTAEGANHAREAVSVARDDAEHSGVVVREAVAAMSEIENSAQQISQIIGVIDEIAFQTNLLALNAGVEAARAGDAGRGFAVVASEVRALAQRSADAAKEIKALISASSQQVDRGVGLVGETGKVLERILTQVTQINGVVVEIASSSQEQATGLQQVNTAVNQMDQVTQQNAAMVEQATAASHALAGEAEALARLIARFELGDAGRAQTSHAPARARPANDGPIPLLKAVGRRGGAAAIRHADPAEEAWDEF